MSEKKTYTPPEITELGSVHDLTLSLNKRGFQSDIYSAAVPLVGSVGPAH